MKLGPVFSLLVLVVLSLFSLHAHAQGGSIKFCPKQLIFNGKCGGTSGGYNCALEFLARYGASAMPQHCTCTDLNPRRLCKCDVVCT